MEPDLNLKKPPTASETERIPGVRLLAKIAEGGMSTVWKAWSDERGGLVAVKILNREFSARGEDVRAFRCEERMMEEIDHPGIVHAYGFDCQDGLWYLIMEYVDGYTFADLLERKGSIGESDALLICESVSAALDFAWNRHGIVHCDLKPENLMINSEGIVKLTDLGISHHFKLAESNTVKEVPEHVIGTPAYISPEQIYSDVELDCRADIYSLGATLYHLSTGHMLFENRDNEGTLRAHCAEDAVASDPRLFNPAISTGFAQLLEAMLVKNRDHRLSSWREVYALANLVEKKLPLPVNPPPSPSSVAVSG